MATLFKHEPTGLYRIQFRNPVTKKRATLYTGLTTMAKAGSFQKGLERLLDCLAEEGRADRESERWIAELGPEFRRKLENLSLISEDESAAKTVGQLFDAYLEKREGAVNVQTRRKWATVRGKIVGYFGEKKLLSALNAADGEDFRASMMASHKHTPEGQDPRAYAEATIRKTCQVANQVFDYGLKRGWITTSPFETVPKSAPRGLQKHYVSRPDFQKILDAAPHDEFRLLLALCRYGGMRNPSETYLLNWSDVDFRKKRFKVTSPKGKRFGKGERYTPIFPELAPILKLVKGNRRTDGPVIEHYRGSNNRTLFEKVIRRAKLEPWEKPFVALRASCETDLVARFPIHVVCQWLGNSPAIAVRHYLQVTDADFLRAATEPHETTQGNVRGNARKRAAEQKVSGEKSRV